MHKPEIVFPGRHYPSGYNVTVTGGHVVSSPTSAYLILVADDGSDAVTVTVTPDTDSDTELPIAK